MLHLSNKFLIILLTVLFLKTLTAFNLKITALKCNVTDKSFAKFEICRVKAESRNLQYYTVYLKLYQVPFSDIDFRFRFMKRANGYKPFLYDFTFKCDFIKHLNAVTSIIWTWFTEVSNLNHSCPFTEDFVIKRLDNRYLQKQLSSLPIPNGDYAFFITLKSAGIHRFDAEFYTTIY